MKQDVKLYISNKLVDFSEELSMPFTYQLKDINEPTIVKNPFTKTIDIIGTPNNNSIFGNIYNFDREQVYDATKLVGAYFNPSVRTPFSIFRNGELIESGYMQLNSITLKGKDINYNITLYGGIGNFFYNLMYNKESEPLTLADLVYGVEDEQTGLPFEDSDREFDFTINKEFVYECFNNVDKDNNNTITDYITFIPSYNGLPENFDSDKVLINTAKNSYWSGTTEKTENSITYKPYNNYVLASLPRKYTEWEILDLRSYLQRPAIKMSKIIEACSNPINNGGYNVELDSDFFNADNPYYKDAWVALPLLTNLENEKNNITTVDGRFVYQDLVIGDSMLGDYTITSKVKKDYIVPTSDFTVINNTYIDYSHTPVGTLTDIEFDFELNFTSEDNSYNTLYTSLDTTWGSGFNYGYEYSAAPIIIQLIVRNEDEIVSYSDNITLLTPIGRYGNTMYNINNYTELWENFENPTKAKHTGIFGRFKKDGETYKFKTYDGDVSNFKVKLPNIPYSPKMQIQIVIKRPLDKQGNFLSAAQLSTSSSVDEDFNVPKYLVRGSFEPSFTKITISRDEPDIAVASNSKITKQFLLKTEKTPADYLLSYSKLFNLFYTVDESSKTVKIQTMSNFFNGKIIDWSDKIDYSKDIKIKPLMFDKKFYCMKQDGESYYLTKYKNEYSVEYGQKRINTNYNFNAETQQLFENNVYQNAISVFDTSPYYHTFVDKDDRILAPFNNSNYTYELFNVSNTNVVESTEVEYKSPAIADAWVWNRKSGYDAFAKTCFFTLESDEKSLADISSVLLFFNGKVSPTNFDGGTIKYKLSDDVPEMYTLNDKTPCWLFSDADVDANGNTITYNCTTLPQFLRYKIIGNQVQASWDFGKPKEIYLPNTTYNDNTTLYEQYWSDYYSDQLDINTKEVSCYINLLGEVVNSELLRNFYYFNGCYWVLNKIENYSINSYDTTKCTFIRVNNLFNYTTNTGEV